MDRPPRQAHRVEKEFIEAKKNFKKENIEYSGLCSVVSLVCDDLQVALLEGTSTLMARAAWIMERVHALERDALRAGINRTFTIARSHYAESINLEMMSHGYAPVYNDDELKSSRARWPPSRRSWQIG